MLNWREKYEELIGVRSDLNITGVDSGYFIAAIASSFIYSRVWYDCFRLVQVGITPQQRQ